ncbi:MAG: hypothetical protein KF901_03800 [Myxococcales bacterium]|nr:hypothetical protein [Myxococcales bacterium]
MSPSCRFGLGLCLAALSAVGLEARVAAQTCSISSPASCTPPTTWPSASAFDAVLCLNPDVVDAFDPCGDSGGNADHRDIVGGPDGAAFQTTSDGTYFYFRLRVNSDPRQGTGFRPFGWGFGLDADGDGAYELYIALDGTGGRVFLRNQDILPGRTMLLPTTELTPVRTNGETTWARADGPLSDPCMNGDADWYITVAVPLRLVLEYGAIGGVIAYGGSSSNSTGIGNDVVCMAGNPASCTTGADCPSGVCLTGVGRCGPPVVPSFIGCVDDRADAIDTGCSAAAPHCVVPDGLEFGECFPCATDAHCADGNECTVDSCVAGACTHVATTPGTPCATGVCSGASAMCVACVTGDQCDAPTPVCDVGSFTCVSCLVDGDCSASAPICDPASFTCVGCLVDGHCPAASPVCNPDDFTCVECVSGATCGDGNECTLDVCMMNACSNPPASAGTTCADGVCSGESAMCVECVDGSTCDVSAPFCVTNACVACRDAADCDDGNDCTTESCVAGACGSAPAGFGAACTGGICNAAMMCVPVEVSIVTPDDGAALGDATPTIAGTATPGTTVTVSIDGVEIGSVTAGPDGTWSVPVTTPLPDGMHTATAVVSTAGGVATDMATFVVDTTTEVAITSPEDGATILDSTPIIRGTGEPGATVVVTIDGTEVGTATVGAEGTWSVSVTTPLANDLYTAEATATDRVGNTATDASTFTVDVATEISITSPANGSTTNDATPTVTGTSVPGATVVVTILVEGETIEVGTVTADAEGDWSIEITTPLPEGTHAVTATATDPIGNRASDESEFTVDTSTTITLDEVDLVTGVVRGTGEPGATVVVTLGGAEVGTTVVDEDGNWILDIDPPGPGTHEVTATATDPAGNSATATTTVTIDAPDGGVDGGTDAGLDAGTDAGRDAGADAGMDAGVSPDAGDRPLEGGYSGGALCAASPSTGDPLALLVLSLVGLALLRRRVR